jgi:hypothetical protein
VLRHLLNAFAANFPRSQVFRPPSTVLHLVSIESTHASSIFGLSQISNLNNITQQIADINLRNVYFLSFCWYISPTIYIYSLGQLCSHYDSSRPRQAKTFNLSADYTPRSESAMHFTTYTPPPLSTSIPSEQNYLHPLNKHRHIVLLLRALPITLRIPPRPTLTSCPTTTPAPT